MRKAYRRVLLLAGLTPGLAVLGCYGMRSTDGGGMTTFAPPREADPGDVAVPGGYRIEAVATGLTFPTGVAFDAEGRPCVVESGYAYGEVFTTPRLVAVEADGRLRTVATGSDNGPWNGVWFHDGAFYVAEGGVLHGGRILRIRPDGATETLIRDLPTFGDHHANGPVVSRDGWVYFGVGTATNSGVVGEDNAEFGWLKRRPSFHDIPGRTVTLTGRTFETRNPLVDDENARAVTGAYGAFGAGEASGRTAEGAAVCTGSVLRVRIDGGPPELVAWGLRNPFGLAFDPAGALYVTDNGYDDRGSRPVWGAADHLWRISPGTWYGWPDFSGGRSIAEEEFQPPGRPRPEPLLAEVPNPPPAPVAFFPCHASADGLDFSRSPAFGHVGNAFVALFGDQVPATGKLLAPVGFKVVRVDVATGKVEDFAVNRGDDNGPASWSGGRGLERPVAVRFDPAGTSLYVVDFGVLLQTPNAAPQTATGVLWRISRVGGPTADGR